MWTWIIITVLLIACIAVMLRVAYLECKDDERAAHRMLRQMELEPLYRESERVDYREA